MTPKRPAPPKPLEKKTGSLSSLSDSGGEDRISINSLEEADDRLAKCIKMRRESVNELVTTEHEYIHDLESLIQVIKVTRKKKEAASVDLKVLMGNIIEVKNMKGFKFYF